MNAEQLASKMLNGNAESVQAAILPTIEVGRKLVKLSTIVNDKMLAWVTYDRPQLDRLIDLLQKARNDLIV